MGIMYEYEIVSVITESTSSVVLGGLESIYLRALLVFVCIGGSGRAISVKVTRADQTKIWKK
jgi:hypothetical protein